MRLTSGENEVDPLTGIPVILGQVRVTQDGRVRATQQTGEAPHGTNQTPGVVLVNPSVPGNATPGVPRGFTEVPKTGPL